MSLNCNSERVNFLVEKQLGINLQQKNTTDKDKISQLKEIQLKKISQWGNYLYPELKNEDVMCALIQVLKKKSFPWELRSQAANVVGGIGTEALHHGEMLYTSRRKF